MMVEHFRLSALVIWRKLYATARTLHVITVTLAHGYDRRPLWTWLGGGEERCIVGNSVEIERSQLVQGKRPQARSGLPIKGFSLRPEMNLSSIDNRLSAWSVFPHSLWTHFTSTEKKHTTPHVQNKIPTKIPRFWRHFTFENKFIQFHNEMQQ